jgi:hypothetical protein
MAGMKYRKLRIAWSVGCGILCLLLVALWVRSYSSRSMLAGGIGHQFVLQALGGQIGFYSVYDEGPDWYFYSLTMKSDRQHYQSHTDWAYVTEDINGWYVIIPFWFPTILFGALAALPWSRWPARFSLRTLLIAMTVAAVGLGWMVYALRN